MKFYGIAPFLFGSLSIIYAIIARVATDGSSEETKYWILSAVFLVGSFVMFGIWDILTRLNKTSKR